MICTACPAPTAAGIHLCGRCMQQLTEILETVPDLNADLDVTTAKLDNHGGNGGSPGFEGSAPVNLGALETARTLRELILSWAVMLLDYDTRQHHPRARSPEQYLTAALPEIRRHDWAGDMLHELNTATRKARNLIDAPRDIRILGKCLQLLEDDSPCDRPLKVDGQQPETICPGCGTLYHVTLLEARNRRRARGDLMTGPESKRWLSKHAGVKIPYNTIRTWINRRQVPYVLRTVNTTNKAVKLVYPGDVLQRHHAG